MAKLKKTFIAIFAVLFAACLIAGAYVFLSGNKSTAAYAETVTIGAEDADEYLEIVDGTLTGFKSGAQLPEGEFILEIPSEGVTGIAAQAFTSENSSNMVGIILPENAAQIEVNQNAFVNLTNLLEVCNLSDVELTAGDSEFGGVALNAINVIASAEQFSRHTTEDGFTFVYNTLTQKWALVDYNGSTSNLHLPAKVEETSGYPEGAYDIYDYAFFENRSIASVTIPEGVTSIGNYAFVSCTSLTRVILPDSLTEIKYSAFSKCSRLAAINWNKVEQIGDYAFNECSALTVLNLPATLKSIGQSAFYDCTGVTALNFAAQSAIESIGRFAFANCTNLGKAVELPASLNAMYVGAFRGCTNISFVYIHGDVTFYNISGGNETGYFAENSVIVFDTLSAYNAALEQTNFSASHQRNATYLINILTYADGTLISGGSTQRLYGYTYDYVKISSGIDKDTWATDSSLTNALAAQKDLGAENYASTVWYKNAEFENTDYNVADTAYVNGLLATKITEIRLHAHKAVAKPDDISKGWTYDENTYIEVDDVLKYFEVSDADLKGMDVSDFTYTDMLGNDPVTTNRISDAGVYTVSVTLDENYGAWQSPALFTVNVSKQEIDLNQVANYGGQFWTLGDGTPLRDETTTTLYVYDGIPYLAPQNMEDGTEEIIKYVKTSYLRYTGDTQTIKVSTNGNKYFTVITEIGNSAKETGSHTASATITATNNYSFYLSNSTQEASERGHYVVINENGTATLTKEWYIIKIPNRIIIGETGDDYQITGWTFGDSTVEIPAPVVETGDFEPSNSRYDALIEFTLIKDGTIVGGATNVFHRNDFANYINWTMPAGSYILIADVGDVEENGQAVEGFITTVRFNVANAKLTVEETAKSYTRNIEDAHFFGNDLTVNYTELDEFKEYWAENEDCFWGLNSEEFYSEGYSFTYNLARMYSGVYYNIGDRELTEKIGADTFTVYYWLTMKNHEFIDVSDRYGYYYTVVGYTEVAAPTEGLTAVYTGSVIVPAIYDTELYSVEMPSNIKEANDYELKLTLNDAAHYKWTDKNYGVEDITLTFTVDKAVNGWFTNPNVIHWTWDAYEKTTNRFIAVPDFGTVQDVRFSIYNSKYELIKVDGKDYFSLDDNGYVTDSVAKALNLFNAGQYYLLASANEKANWYGINTDVDKDLLSANAVEFNVIQATNTWTNSPNVIRWTWGEFDKDVNLISAVPTYGTGVEFTITSDAEGKKPVTGLEKFTTQNGKVSDDIAKILNGLSTTGSYYLTSKVGGSTNYTELSSTGLAFNVFIMNNYWKDVPEIRGWSEGRYDETANAIKASALTGDVVITITDLDGNVIKESDLAGLGIGEYILTAKVAATDNYTGLENSIHFFVVEDSVGMSGIIAAAIVFACFDVICAGFCIALVFIRKKKIEDRFRRMIKSELHKGE